MQRTKGLQTEKKQNNLFRTIIWKNMWYNRKETILLIICEMLIVAIAYSGSMCYQILSAKHSSEIMLLQEDGISRQFIYAGMLLLFCGIVLIITVMVSYLGKRIPQYMLLKRMGISSAERRAGRLFEVDLSGHLSGVSWNLWTELSADERAGS